MPFHGPLYHYRIDGVEDSGWGCVYRSLQTSLGAVGHPVPHITTIMKAMGTHAPYLQGQRGQALWLEPALAASYLREHWGVECEEYLYCPHQAAMTRILKTPPEHYRGRTFSSIDPMIQILRQHFAQPDAPPIILDNGISCYNLAAGEKPGRWVLLDPHSTESGVRRPVTTAWLQQAPLWMIAMPLPDPAMRTPTLVPLPRKA